MAPLDRFHYRPLIDRDLDNLESVLETNKESVVWITVANLFVPPLRAIARFNGV